MFNNIIRSTDAILMESKPTIGFEFITKYYTIEDEIIQVHLWDTAGQDKYMAISDHYYKKASGSVVLFDLTSRESFKNLSKWIEDLSQKGEESVEMVIVGNKSDLVEERVVTEKEARIFADDLSATYMESSSLTKDNIKEVFETIVSSTITSIKDFEARSMSNISRKNTIGYSNVDARLQQPSIYLNNENNVSANFNTKYSEPSKSKRKK